MTTGSDSSKLDLPSPFVTHFIKRNLSASVTIPKALPRICPSTSAKKIGASIVCHRVSSWHRCLLVSPKCLPGVSLVSPWCLLVSPGVIGASSFPPGGQFSKYADAARYAPDLPGLYRINPIPNVHFLTFFRDVVHSLVHRPCACG